MSVHRAMSNYSDPDDLAPPGDEALVVPRPGSIIRRTARTKIRKGGPGGEGFGSRRFSSTRAGRRLGSPVSPLDDESPRHSLERHSGEQWREDRKSDGRGSDETSEERSSESRHTSGDSAEDKLRTSATADTSTTTDDSIDNDEALIFDAYAHDRSESSTSDYDRSRSPSPDRPILPPISVPKISDGGWYDDEELTPTQDSAMSAALHAMTLLSSAGPSEDIFQQQQRQQEQAQYEQQQYEQQQYERQQYEQQQHEQQAQRARAGQNAQMSSDPRRQQIQPEQLPPGAFPRHEASQDVHHAPVPPPERPPMTRVDSASSSISAKEKAKEKEKKHSLFGSKKDKKDKEKDKSKKEKDRFLGSLFGSKKKSEEASSVANFSTAGPAAAAALLGTSKSAKSLHPSGASSPTSPGFNNFARYPIHVERAVYRLSHIKLANARRPLIEQVLISNLMFWYLGIIGRNPTQNEEKKGLTNGLDKTRPEAAQNPQLKGTPPQPADTGSAGVKQEDPPAPVRKTGLTKPERSRGTNSESAFKPPQYGAQTAQMDQEMRGPPPNHQQQQHRQMQMHHQQQQHGGPHHPQQYSQPAPQRVPSDPARARSPPQQQQHQQQQRGEYPPGVAPPRPPGAQYGPPMGQGRPQPAGGPPRGPPHPSLLPNGQPHMGGPPPQMAPRPQGYQNGPRPDPRPYHAGPPQQKPPGMKPLNKSGPQVGQIFQYPGMQARPPGAGGPQPGQIFSAPGHFQHTPFQQPAQSPRPISQGQPQRPPQQGGWQPPQRLPSGGPQQRVPGPPQMQEGPQRRAATNPDAYGRPNSPQYQREGSTSPPNQNYYASGQRPASMQPGQYQYAPPPPGQSRQPVASGQYPHHR